MGDFRALSEGAVALAPHRAPLRFGGELAPHCRLRAGPTLDLNLMLRRSAGSGEMRRAQPGSTAPAGTPWRALYTAEALTLELDGALMPVDAGTLLWLQSAEPVGWQLAEDGPAPQAWWMSWRPA